MRSSRLGNVIWLAIALAVVKVVHELGHALTCRHFGGDCHEVGVLLLLLHALPVLQRLRRLALSRANGTRIAVSAAGIAVEVFLAAIATFLWWFSAPGCSIRLCLNIMLVCSLSTLLFNGNPLLRYDGYYVLADLLEVPNLGQQSRWLLGRMSGRFLPRQRCRRPIARCLATGGRFCWPMESPRFFTAGWS